MHYFHQPYSLYYKAFTKFHRITLFTVKEGGITIKSFEPLKLKVSLKGGYLMDYKIVQKEKFTVLCVSKQFSYESAKQDIPLFWHEHRTSVNGKLVCGMFGISIDEQKGNEQFEYLIADVYNPTTDIPEGLATRTIPAFTWAVFPCKGAMPISIQNVNRKICAEWIPSIKEYEVAAGYCVEMYDNPDKYPNGIQDENYYSEMWIPVKKK